ncbi:Uncharacterised protein [Vibrio cholerae]|nr:Uncharacterised protein [Vibrio cholerae]
MPASARKNVRASCATAGKSCWFSNAASRRADQSSPCPKTQAYCALLRGAVSSPNTLISCCSWLSSGSAASLLSSLVINSD